ncbi:hypothetical protein ElyMa_001129900 [Elysia marginata]|uniref:Uncharacterized protein n=1 Tax=Elysia marginata TaxID=1093978 RepID=A0AAV4HYM5_9GAST|nr:hypothetical protein ElyMa_001129900 [Elysia marginata]
MQYKIKAKQLGATSKEYTRTALNLVNPRTPEKRVAFNTLQKQHPCKVLFVEDEMAHGEEELGLVGEQELLKHGPIDETSSSISKPLHNDMKPQHQSLKQALMRFRDLLEELNSDLLEPTNGTFFDQHFFIVYWQFQQCRQNPEKAKTSLNSFQYEDVVASEDNIPCDQRCSTPNFEDVEPDSDTELDIPEIEMLTMPTTADGYMDDDIPLCPMFEAGIAVEVEIEIGNRGEPDSGSSRAHADSDHIYHKVETNQKVD